MRAVGTVRWEMTVVGEFSHSFAERWIGISAPRGFCPLWRQCHSYGNAIVSPCSRHHDVEGNWSRPSTILYAIL